MRYGGKQFRCKVQTGRRGGNGPLIPGVYRLVTFLVRRIALPVHVMGKRQPSVLFLVHFPVKPDQAVPFRIDSLHHSHGFSDGNGASHLHFAPRTHHALPQKGIEHLGPDNLNGTVIGKIPGGDTLVSLRMKWSPGLTYSGRSQKCLCSIKPVSRWSTSIREAARSGRGRSAINSSGRG